MGRLFLIGGLMIRSCQGLGGVLQMINAFFTRPNLNTTSLLEDEALLTIL